MRRFVLSRMNNNGSLAGISVSRNDPIIFMTIQQNNDQTEAAAKSSTAVDSYSQPSDEPTEQKVILLPRKAYDPRTFWIGVLAKYFDIWVPTFPVHLKEDGSPYTFDFYSESHSKLVKIFTPYDEENIKSYLDLPYAKYILFVLDVNRGDPTYECECIDGCENCDHLATFAKEMGAYICNREDTDVVNVTKRDDEGQWNEVGPRRY